MQLALALAIAALAQSGCFDEGASFGERGRAQFAWDQGLLGCLFGCDADEPMAAHSVAMIEVLNHEELPPYVVSSSSPSVLEFFDEDPEGSGVRCESHEAGSAHLVLSDATTGEEIDRFEIAVHDVARIEVAEEELFREELTIMVGGERGIGLDLRDDRGRELVGIGGVSYGFSGGIDEESASLADAYADFIASLFVGTTDEGVTIEALALGAGAVTASARSGATLEIPVRIVDESVVTRVEVEARGELEAGSAIIFDCLAFAGAEPVYAPVSTCSLEPADGAIAIDWESRGTVQLAATGPGSATLTCRVGGATASAEVHVD